MKVLIGTTNPSKVERFKSLLEGYDLKFLSLKDLDIHVNQKKLVLIQKKMQL